MSDSGATIPGAKIVATDCPNGVTDAGRSWQAALWAGLSGVIAAYNTGQAIKFADKQHEIAKQYLKIAEWMLDYHKSAYRPVEDQELAEAMALKEEDPIYDVQRGRAQVAARIQAKGQADKQVQCTSEYCTGLRAVLLRDALAREATTVAALSELGYRNERAHIEARSDVRWQKMVNTAQRGRDMQANAVSYGQFAFGIFGDLGTQAAQGAAGAAGAFGYWRNRRETLYPTTYRIDPIQQAMQGTQPQTQQGTYMSTQYVQLPSNQGGSN